MAELSIYDPIGAGEKEVSAKMIKTVLDELKAQGSPDIEVSIHSVGGSVIEGMAIYELLDQYEGKVTTKAVNAISIASIIALAGDERIMAANGRIMIHRAEGEGTGTADKIRSGANLVESLEDDMVSVYQKRTKLPEQEIRTLMAQETWLNSEQALALGFITQIGPENATAAKMDLSKYKNYSAPSVGPVLSETETKKAGDPVSSVVTVKALKQKFPKASNDFIVKAMEQEATEEEATAMYTESMEEEYEELQAKYDEMQAKYTAMEEELTAMKEAATAMEEEKTATTASKRVKVVSGVSANGSTAEVDYGALWTEKVDEIQAKRKCDRVRALSIASTKFGDIQAKMIEQANR